MLIPIEELRQTEAKCNLLMEADEDYHHVLGSLETKYGAKVQERLLRRIVHGGVGPIQLCLEEIAPEEVSERISARP